MLIVIEAEAAGTGFEMAVLQKRILHKKAKISEVLVFLIHESPWPGATGADQTFKDINGRADGTGIETCGGGVGMGCARGAQGTAGARVRRARKRERDLAQATTLARV
jgi:hypothetical protein